MTEEEIVRQSTVPDCRGYNGAAPHDGENPVIVVTVSRRTRDGGIQIIASDVTGCQYREGKLCGTSVMKKPDGRVDPRYAGRCTWVKTPKDKR